MADLWPMGGGRGVRGNREVSPLFLLGGGGGRVATTPGGDT